MPMMWGMRSLLQMMGARRMMQSTTKKMDVGSVMGKYVERLAMLILFFLVFA